ncbi:hypothetical protein PC121_g22662 [Phytophthora cactorum]|nr:hypothetical protein PC121_g22662 [Phytophthora cactorum]
MIRHVPDVVQQCWRLGLVTVFQQLWKWRGEYADADPETSQCRFEAILKARLRQNYPIVEASFLMDGAQPVRRAATSVVNSLSALHTDFVLSIIPKGITYVLLFDDGSRGNPGPGGSGTVILKIVAGDTAATPVWLTSMSYGAVSTTNNKTENRGLLNGLSHAKSDNLRPLHVFGDSKMIITQMDYGMLHSIMPPGTLANGKQNFPTWS